MFQTGNEASVERLLKQIGNFMSEIADEFKIVVVEAIRSLCLKFPQKHRALVNFLSNILREEGGFEYKKAIVDSVLILIREIPQAKVRLENLTSTCIPYMLTINLYCLPVTTSGEWIGPSV